MNTTKLLADFYNNLREIYRLECVLSLLDWDQKVMMPPEGAEDRAEQVELLSTLIHERKTAPEVLETVDALFGEIETLSPDDASNVREIKRNFDRARKLPDKFVAERARVSSLAYDAWVEARPKNDFKGVKKHLEKIIQICREEAELVGYQENPYDALLQVYEPYSLISEVKPLLLRLAEKLAELTPKITKNQQAVSNSSASYAEAEQHRLNTKIAEALGYNLKRGRLDKTAHPFEASLGLKDIRITTRFNSSNYLSSIFTTLHEAGHALYEGGFLEKHKGTPLGQPISLGIHESQSRLWENIIGRSHEFCTYLYSILGDFFPQEKKAVTPELLWKQANRVTPSLIRVEADEVTYSLHIIIRMLLEEELMNRRLEVADLPAKWSAYYEKYLGIKPKDDKDGVMQDVHWYMGALGYFPTYALGNLYGAMMFSSFQKAYPSFMQEVAQGKFLNLTAWLRKNVHEQGMRYNAAELIQRIAQNPLTETPFIEYLENKFSV